MDFMISGGYNVSSQIKQVYVKLFCHLIQPVLVSFSSGYRMEPLTEDDGVGITLRTGEKINLHINRISFVHMKENISCACS